jgi:hypothetical protein
MSVMIGGGYDEGWGDLPGPEPDYEPDPEYLEAARARWRFDSLFPHDERHFDPSPGRFTDPEMERASRFDNCIDPLAEMFRAVLFLRGWRLGQRIPWPALAFLLRLLVAGLTREAWQDVVAGPLGADRRPAADLSPPVALLRARSVLTCAPPARVPCQAGTTG